ncbi:MULTISPECIES: PEP-CTERM sorting domain-containing protein [unclassified Duganella]|uniref:PEP-CTERM sorting domain-containing protein n=1 Tax=unclassified Duganella TaxID=2636909 RepID=UPI000E34E664|nr:MULTISPECIES: PEP-CTERM sorting domain-containing protein [unclassified Duganella]RFP10073.1 PEP-CTERM sorting domain-containing protein [Duganella sp. BJB475]RFP25621.1 PEP-CTERM sorting domain-containing protein [Duganella sp. BJB476]
MKALAIALACMACAGSALADNVALNGAVTLTGSGFGNSDGWLGGALAAPSTVTDGVYLPIGTQWNTGTVFWTGDVGADTVMITLNHTSVVSQLNLQADNDNNYLVQYRDTSNVWHDAAVIVPHRSWGQDNGSVVLGTPVTATAFMISGTTGAGDNHFSVSEFEAIGRVVAVPEPETYTMLGAGLAMLGWMARRKQRRS